MTTDTGDIRDGAKIIDAQRARDMVQICDVAEAAITLLANARMDPTLQTNPLLRQLESAVAGLPDRLIRELCGR